ncbi:leucine-rich PPR motif-containing protein%2C mitochondrial [Xyrichtys novacula]|uniref:Leucine-rich PPR motif-containing protein, mitochondrial n=1 Tax=Xyrichtys novacula TaxID=13765 RepID=A0AAV1G347_XYRNO|nr:leucine-rich PPR motif-containing protein%2C mitochondrial [Xyrichtys novacula]
MPFHSATVNMAALLRSARLLKFSPSGLLHITGLKRTGPSVGRLYSGVVGGNKSGVCSRQISRASENASSRQWPYTVGFVRNYATAEEQKNDVGLVIRTKQMQKFDWALTKLDSSVRRTGRITKTLLNRIFHDICRTGYPSGNHALLLLRSCGSLLPEIPLQERNDFAHRIWEKLQEMGAQYDVSHYNALLKVYLQNDFKFSPTDFLAKMEEAHIQPNRVTYQRLIAAYCQDGNIEGASTILGFMKSKDLPITDAVFNSLVTGHARAGDIESAKNILPVMKGAGIEPGPDTYIALMNAYAEKGDMESLKLTMKEAETAECSLMDRDIMQVIFTLAKAGQEQHIQEMTEHLRHERGYVPDAMNLCLSLITQGLEDTAFQMLKTFPSLQSESANMGNFFLRHCVSMDTSLEKLSQFCKELQELQLHSSPLSFTLSCALEANKPEMSFELMKEMKEQDFPIRPHYFWPLLTWHLKNNDQDGVIEVLKNMQKLGVPPDVESLTTYILPVFPDMEAAEQALKESGVSTDSAGYLSSQVRFMTGNLEELYTKLSDPSFPPLDLNNFRSKLSVSFRKFDDFETMMKITKLLYTDKRFSLGNPPAENVGYFLYNLIDSMSEKEVQAQEGNLRMFFNELRAQNMLIPSRICRGIKNLLDPNDSPQLIKEVVYACSSLCFTPRCFHQGKLQILEKKIAELQAENKPLGSVFKQVIQALCVTENLQRALELKQQYESEMTVPMYVNLINMCCRLGNLEEAVNLRTELYRMDSSVVMDVPKYISLVKILSEHGRVEEAIGILKEMKEKDVAIGDTYSNMFFHVLNSLAVKGDVSTLHQLTGAVFTLGLAKPSNNLCSPLVSTHLERDDLTKALEAAIDCGKTYKVVPRIHEIIVGLVQRGDTEQLQKAMDFLSEERGEMTMLYNLCFAFLESGRYREARKIIETPGMRSRPGRLYWFAKRCVQLNQMETLEQMVDITAKLFECDRDEMYSHALLLCKERNDWKRAEAFWTKMQEESFIPRERTLLLLAEILRNNGKEVPFEVPEIWYQQDEITQADTTEQVEEQATETETETETKPPKPPKPTLHESQLIGQCKRGRAKEAFQKLKDAEDKSPAGPVFYDQLIRALLSEGSLEEAMEAKDIAQTHLPNFYLGDMANTLLIVTLSKKGRLEEALKQLRTMLQFDQVPRQLAITRLVQAMGDEGDVAGIQEVESLMQKLGTSLNMSKMVFTNNKALAYIRNGDVDLALEELEGVLTNPEFKNTRISFVYKKVMEENNDKAMDKLAAMAERLANHFALYQPATDLFLQLVDFGKIEDAKFMLARCNAIAEQKDAFFGYLIRTTEVPGQLEKLKNLLSLVPDCLEKERVNTFLMKCHSMDKDFPAAKALYEQMLEEGVTVNELSLKRLAMLYRSAGEPVPFTEPPESFRFYANKLKEEGTKGQETPEE